MVISRPEAIAPLTIRDYRFQWGSRTYLMGVLNVTPDSFSDGGQFHTLERAIAQAHQLAADGADILDIGGQSTRPQAEEVSEPEELQRVVPVIEALRAGWATYPPLNLPISVDTTKARVAEVAIAAGADLVNDISGATFDDRMLSVVAKLGVPLILMHSRGTPKTMQQMTNYGDLLGEICAVLAERMQAAQAEGIPAHHLILDPGIGFAKTVAQNLELLRQIRCIRELGAAVLIGPSRKSFIGHILDQPDPSQRVWGTAAACCAAIAHQADILRVHDVQAMRDVSRVADAIWRSPLNQDPQGGNVPP
jgi:dihydropteroate synthase